MKTETWIASILTDTNGHEVGAYVVRSGDKDICSISSRDRTPIAEKKANVTLIAAAPDLLAALKGLVEIMEPARDSFKKSGSWDEQEEQAYQAALAAIEKATGKEIQK